MRGKVLNTYEVNRDHLFANAEIHDISVAIGVDKETRELVVLIHDHDGYANLIVSRAVEDIDEETDVDEIKTEPIGDEVLKAFGL